MSSKLKLSGMIGGSTLLISGISYLLFALQQESLIPSQATIDYHVLFRNQYTGTFYPGINGSISIDKSRFDYQYTTLIDNTTAYFVNNHIYSTIEFNNTVSIFCQKYSENAYNDILNPTNDYTKLMTLGIHAPVFSILNTYLIVIYLFVPIKLLFL